MEGIGARVARKEDKRFITGMGRYVDDMVVPGMKHAVFVRSPHAHAEIKKIDVKAAQAMPGVIGVLTGKELKADGIGNLICGWMIHSNNRLIPNAMEPRAPSASYNRADDNYTLYVSQPEPARRAPADDRLLAGHGPARAQGARDRPRRGRRLRLQDLPLRRRDRAVWASKKLNRPIKWTADRSESFLSDAHGRDHVTTAEPGDGQGRQVPGPARAHHANLGAYLSTFASRADHPVRHAAGRPVRHAARSMCEVAACSPTPRRWTPTAAPGRPEATYVVERWWRPLPRGTGHRPGRDPPRNFITSFPYQTPVGLTYDTGDYDATLRPRPEAGRRGRLRSGARPPAKAKGLLRGIGYSSYIEACGIAPSQRSPARWARAPACSNRRGARAPHRQRDGVHRLAQPRPGPRDDLRAGGGRQAGHPDRDVDIVHGDTGKVPFGMGTYGSRSLASAARPSSRRSTRSIAKGKKIAAHLLEAARPTSFANGEFKVAGTDKKCRSAGGAHRLRAAQLPARQAGAGPERERVLRPDQLHLPGRHLHLRGRGRPGHRRGRDRGRFTAATTSATSSTR
jgi:carbon-monoxide dehydrogenase large subunit